MFFGEHRSVMRHIGLLAGAVALLFQVFAWTMTMPAKSADGDWITICSADGLTRIQVDADGTPVGGDEPASADHAGSCPLCPVIGGLSLPPSLVLAALPQVLIRHGAVTLTGDRIAAGWFLSALQARAPPLHG